MMHSPDDVRGFGPETNAPPPKVTIGSLFSGIGGLDLGLEVALRDGGFDVETVFQCEADPWCRDVLARHWPSAVRYDDVRHVGADVRRVDVLCGGFPCQDVSASGKGAGLAGERSGLWREFARIIRTIRPFIVVVENVATLAARGLGEVLGNLSEAGYDAQWFTLRAHDVGAPHLRERLFIVAWDRALADPRRFDGDRGPHGLTRRESDGETTGRPEGASHAQRGRREDGQGSDQPGLGGSVDGVPERLDIINRRWPANLGQAQHSWEPPRVGGDARCRKSRLRALGNAVSPQCGYAVGCAVAAVMRGKREPSSSAGAAPPRPPLPLKAGVSAASHTESENR